MPARGIARGAEAAPGAFSSQVETLGSPENATKQRGPFMQAIGKALGQSLDQATYAGYRVGFEAARDEAALLAELAGQVLLAAQIRAMRPLPDKHEKTA
jgi:hypothetical protein